MNSLQIPVLHFMCQDLESVPYQRGLIELARGR